MKWLALVFVVIGVVAIAKGIAMNSTSSFDNGTFLGQMVLWGGGVCFVGIGIAIFLIVAFQGMT